MQFNDLVTRVQMGNAYQSITGRLGPSAQLLAFINYDQVTNESLGLESLEIMDLHTQTLAAIDADPSFDMALEMLTADLTEIVERDGDHVAVEGMVGKFFRSFFSRLPDYNSYVYSKRYVQQLHSYAVQAINDMPNSLDLKKWQAYDAKITAKVDSINKEVNAMNGEKMTEVFNGGRGDKAVRFSKTGWTKERYEAEMRWIEGVEKEAADIAAKNKDKVAKVKALLTEADSKEIKDKAEVMKLVKANISDIDYMIQDLSVAPANIRPMLAKVAKHLED